MLRNEHEGQTEVLVIFKNSVGRKNDQRRYADISALVDEIVLHGRFINNNNLLRKIHSYLEYKYTFGTTASRNANIIILPLHILLYSK